MIIAKRAFNDPPSGWTGDYTNGPDGFKKQEYQEMLNGIAGLSRGKPILLLEWGGNTTVTRYSKWDGTGNPTEEIIEPKYKLRRESLILPGTYYFVPIRRWVIAQRAEPEQYGYGDDSDNTFVTEEGTVAKFAEKPKELYTPLIYVGDHSKCTKNCCEERICLGDYKNPDFAELKWIAEKTHLLKSERFVDPYSKISAHDIQRIIRENKKPDDHLEKMITQVVDRIQ